MVHRTLTAKDHITPLIEIPEKGFDFESWQFKKTIDEHLEPIAKRIKTNWEQRPCFVDFKLIPEIDRMGNGLHPTKFVFDQMRARQCLAIPVTGLTRDAAYHSSVMEIHSKDKRGICLRITIEEAAHANLSVSINQLLGKKITVSECDLIVDLQAPTFHPIEQFATVVKEIIRQIPHLNVWRTLTLIGTSFPENMGELHFAEQTIPRSEWVLYKRVINVLQKEKIRCPTFGDYAINHPAVIQKDMRLLKPGGTVRYAIDDGWLIVKGPNVRDNGFGQYVGHCKKIIGSASFGGPACSDGDKYIFDCANGNASTGNLSTWRRVGTNRHMEKVVQDVSNFYGV